MKNQYISFSRGYAILTIILFHYLKDLPLAPGLIKVVNLGGGGVHLFIFASGFGLALSRYEGTKKFFTKRLKKVYVPYALTVMLIFLINIFIPVYPNDGWLALISHIFLFKMFYENLEVSFGPHFWFLSTIIQFYLFFPLIRLLVGYLNPRSAFFASLTLSLTYSLAIVFLEFEDIRIYNSFFLQYLWEFVLGMIVAKSNILDRLLHFRTIFYGIFACVSYLIMWLMVKYLGDIGKNLNDIFSFTGYVCLSIIMYKLSESFEIVKRGFLSIELFSYPLFLVHYLTYDLAKIILFKDNMPVAVVPLILILTLLVAFFYGKLLGMVPKHVLKKPMPVKN